MEETVDLREYFGIVKKRFWIVALITIIAVVVSGVISFFMLNPVYEAKSTLIVNTEKNEETQMITGDQFNVTQKLAVTYGEIIKSRSVLDDVIKNLKLDDEYGDLVKNVITKANDIQVIDKAILPQNPIKPNKMMNMAIAAVLGAMIGLFVVFLIEYLDNKLKTPQDIEKHLGLSVLGVVPNEKLER